MEVHEVKLVLEKDGWHIYQDGMQVIEGFFVPKDKVIAKFEARQTAKKLSPCELIVIDYSGMCAMLIKFILSRMFYIVTI